MTIGATTHRMTYTGDGLVSTYAYTFKIFEQTDLLVIITDTSGGETTQTLTTDYTVTGVGAEGGGNIVLVTALTNLYTMDIRRVVDLLQETNIRNQGAYYAGTHEDKADYLTMIDQQQQDEIARSVRIASSDSDSGFDPVFPGIITTALSLAPITNAAGTGWAAITDWPSAADIAAAEANAAAAAASALDAAASAGARTYDGINNLSVVASVASSALTLTLAQADGTALSTGTSSGGLYFRNTTAATGTYAAVNSTAAITLVVPSGATLGGTSALSHFLYVYMINNVGTSELAISGNSNFDEGAQHTTTSISTGADDASTLYSTTARTSVAIRLVGKFVSTQTTAGTWAAVPTENSPGFLFKREDFTAARTAAFNIQHGVTYLVDTTGGAIAGTLPTANAGDWFEIVDTGGAFDTNNFTIVRAASESIDGVAATRTCSSEYLSFKCITDGTNWFTINRNKQMTTGEVHLEGGDGHGSTNTKIRKFAGASVSTGSALTYATTAAAGMSVTVNEPGLYTVDYIDGGSGASVHGISVNCAALTTDVFTLIYATGLRGFSDSAAGGKQHVGWTGRMAAADVVRAQTDAGPDTSGGQDARFVIVKIAD